VAASGARGPSVTPVRAAASIAHLMTQDMDANVRRHGVLLVLQRMLGQTASPERLKQLRDVGPEEAADRRIANPDEAVFTGLYLVNAAQRRVSNSASITQKSAYLRAHV
jgi:hypothetical protein